MDKPFWLAIREEKYAVPAGHDILPLTEELFSYLGSADPDLRDTIAYETFANWLEQGLYTQEQIRAYLLRLTLNLHNGLGEVNSDSLFGRTFSILCLAEIVNYNNQHPFLDRDEILNTLKKGLDYLQAEADPRGYVAEKGWGHALAHTADLLFVLARSLHTHASEHIQILNAIAAELVHATHWIYVHGEDDRLVRAVTAIFERDLLDEAALADWLSKLTNPTDGWKNAWTDEERTRAFFNVRNFLRSLALRVVATETLPHKEKLQGILLEAHANLRPY